MSNTTHAGSSSLRHSSSHRQAIAKRQQAITTVVVARRPAQPLDSHPDLREQMAILSDWAKAAGRQGRHIHGESQQGPCGGISLLGVLEVRGLVALPAKQGDWTITKATTKEEAWARRKAGLSC